MKKIVIIASIFLLLLVGFSYIRNKDSNPPTETTTDQTQTQQQSGLVLIIFDGERPLVFNRDYSEGQTAFSILKDVTDKEGIGLEVQEYDFGVFVKSLNGMESSAEMAWIYFVNGVSGQIAADKMELANGDVVEWKFITPDGE
jgi:hypothetical protein